MPTTQPSKILVIPTLLTASFFGGCFSDSGKPSPSTDSPTIPLVEPEQESCHFTECDAYKELQSLLLDKPIKLSPEFIEWAKQCKSTSTAPPKSFHATENPISEKIIQEMVYESYGYMERFPALADEIRKSSVAGTIAEDGYDTVFSLTDALLKDKKFQLVLMNLYTDPVLSCEERASTYLSVFAELAARNPKALFLDTHEYKMSYIIGFVFDENFAPLGNGHAWLQSAGTIIDPSLMLNGELTKISAPNKHYIPLIGYEVNVQHRQGTPKKVSIHLNLTSYIDVERVMKPLPTKQ